MRICNVALAHDPAFGGLHRAVGDFARALDAPIVSFDAGSAGAGSVEEGVAVRRVGCGSGWLTRGCHLIAADAARRAEEAVGDADLVVVHSLFRGHAEWARRWATRRGRRLWAVPHGCLDPWGLAHRGLLKRLWLGTRGRPFLAAAERVICSSRRSLEKARSWLPRDSGVVVHWPVDRPADVDRDAARRLFRGRHGIPEDARLLLFLARLHAVKRPVETVRAFCEAAGRGPAAGPACHLAIVGMAGDLPRSAVRDAVPAASRDRVHLLGGLSGAAVGEAYRASDGFVSLSFQENFGYAMADAAAHGLPVILSPGHDLAHEMPSQGGRLACGWLLGDDSRAAAVGAIGEFAAASEADLVAAGAAGRSWVGEVLDRGRFAERLRLLAEG